MKPAGSDHKLWTHCRFQAPDIEVLREPGQRDDPKQFVLRVRHMRWGKCQEALLTRPATAVREGLTLDTGAMRIHPVGGEDVRLALTGGAGERVYMPTTLAHFWAPHRAMWATQRQTASTAGCGGGGRCARVSIVKAGQDMAVSAGKGLQ